MTGPPPDIAAARLAVRRALSDLAPGDLVLVACSGGPDSLALTAAAAFAAPRLGLRAGGVTVDHGLQEGSADRAAWVAAEMASLGLEPVESRTVAVDGGGGPEGAARSARYAALDAAAEACTAAAVLLGHTRDDQAETVLLGLARGSGARSLSGMPAVTGRYRRPFLGLDRRVVRSACDMMGLDAWQDPHNADPAYTRSRVRHDALPSLEAALGPGITPSLARTADLLRDDADALDLWAEEVRSRAGTEHEGQPALDVTELGGVPRAVRTRVLRRTALESGCPAGELTARHVAELERLVSAWRGQKHIPLPGGVRGWRTGKRIVLASGAASGRDAGE
ncbi:tRNA(Ile)-lysidine synthase [Haloactinospora alba]|uniref:tRNA(Ile)-lysidine synthase n=1 Tax=Haloactinospora alba TaxID=405555 RepID=A0A543NMW7_9ACTN|nr:tRNA lysidine(34) synthetase TilS [Haloactinospora alba]TQN33175.1 tRNA(Ile)-lysidine synthase [Haloactinospora alba]